MSRRGLIAGVILAVVCWAAIFGLLYAAVRWGPL
jgi:hypothetical protein